MLRKIFSKHTVATFFILTIILFTLYLIIYFHILPNLLLHNINTAVFTFTLKQLAISDYKRLIDLDNFQFHLLNKCTFDPFLLVLIHSPPKNFKRRKSIRETWGCRRKNLKIFFALGTVEDLQLQEKVEEENERYKDLIQGTFLDSYRNLTYKHVMLFKYTIYHCPNIKYMLKTDDDQFVNMPVMLDFLTLNLSRYHNQDLLVCTVWTGMPVIRNPYVKWFVEHTTYKKEIYPKYCLGSAIVYSRDTLFTLYEDAQKSKYFWIDDVFVTGILAEDKDILFVDVGSLVLSFNDVDEAVKRNGSLAEHFLYGPTNIGVRGMYLLWNIITNQTSNKAVKLQTK